MKINQLIQEQAQQFSQNNLYMYQPVFRHVLPTRHMFQALQQFATQVNSRLELIDYLRQILLRFSYSRLLSLFYI